MTAVKDLMSTDVVTVSPELSLRNAAELLAVRHIGGAPVMSGGRIVGVVSMSDILSFEASTPVVPSGGVGQAEWDREPPEEWGEGDEAPAAFFEDVWSDAGADVVERFEQTGAVVGPAGMPWYPMASGVTVYTVRGGRISEGTYVKLDPVTPSRPE